MAEKVHASQASHAHESGPQPDTAETQASVYEPELQFERDWLPPGIALQPYLLPRLGGEARAQSLLNLQRTIGNRSVQRAIDRSRSTESGDDLAQRICAASSSGGTSLDIDMQRRLGAGLGADLSAVRVHTDAEANHLARSVESVAFTTGQDIFFRSGAYAPSSPQGLHLLAHEAAHTVQQSAGPVAGTSAPGGVSISDPSDSFEQAAEQAAYGVLSGAPAASQTASSATVQRQAAPEEEEEMVQTRRVDAPTVSIQRQAAPEEGEEMVQTRRTNETVGNRVVQRAIDHSRSTGPDGDLARRIQAASAGGSALDAATRDRLQTGLNADLSSVRVHTDDAADRLSHSVEAVAFTTGPDIFFRRGAYDPASPQGLHLLAHEATHVIQQSAGPVAGTSSPGGVSISDPADSFEQAAEQAAHNVLSGTILTAPHAAKGGRIQRQATLEEEDEERVQRSPDNTSIRSLLRLDVRTYTSTWSWKIPSDLANQMAQVTVPTRSPFVTWEDLSGQTFIAAAMRPVTNAGSDLWNVLTTTLAPLSPEGAVNRGRDADENGTSPMEYNPAVAQELRILYTRQINDSLSRIMPRYLAAKSQTMLEAEARAHSTRISTSGAGGSASTLSPGPGQLTIPALGLAPVSAPHEPPPSDIAPSYPMDRHVISALVSGVAIVDVEAYRKSAPRENVAVPKPARTVDFAFEVNTGPLAWVRVTSSDATAEDVAHTLYGDATLAYTVIAASPLFGVDPQKISDKHLPMLRAASRTGFAAGDTSGFGPTDQMLAVPQHDEAAVNQAMDLPLTAKNKDEVVQRMRLTLTHLDDLAASAKTFGLDKWLAPVRAKADARSQALQASADPNEAIRWDAQSAEQLALVIKAANGMREAARQYTAMKAPTSDSAQANDVPDYVERPLMSIAEGYVDAAAISDLVSTAGEKLAAVDEKTKTYPVDVLDGALEALRGVLTGVKTNKRKLGFEGSRDIYSDEVYGVPALEEQQAALRARLVTVRDTLLSNPTQAAKDLKQIQTEIDDLQTDVAMVGHLDTIDTLVWEILTRYSKEGEQMGDRGTKFGPNAKYEAVYNRLLEWRRRVDGIQQEFRKGDKARAREEFKKFLAEGRFVYALQRTAYTISDLERREALDKLIFRLAAMVGIAVATMGIGTLVEGGLVGAGWTAAGFGSAAAFGTTVVVSGAEALSFTLLSRQILETDSEHGSFILEFLTNWGLFTVMKGVGAGYKAFIGEEAAATLVGKGTGLLVDFTAMTATSLSLEYAKKKANGQELTNAEARDIVLQSAAMYIGTAIAARLSEPMLQSFRLSGRAFGARLKAINTQRAQLRVKAEALEISENIKQAPEILAKDADLLDQEQALLKDVIHAALDPHAPPDERLSAQQLAELGELRQQNTAVMEGNARTRLMLKLEPAGGNIFLANKGELNTKGGIADEYRALGDEVTPGPKDPVTQSESVSVNPADGSDPIRIVEKAGPKETAPDTASSTGTGGCFIAGTLVITKLGYCAIENLAIDDVVLAGDPATGEHAFHRVSHTWIHHGRTVLDIQIGDTILTCTPAHPFWVSGAGWQVAGTLRPGMLLLTQSGETWPVLAVKERADQFTVFNLEVEGLQTYFVSDLAILVHNKAWELLPGLRPARTRVGELRQRINTMQREGARTVLADRANRLEQTLTSIDDRSNRVGSLREVERLKIELRDAQIELAQIDRLSVEPVPLPTMDEQVQSDRYVTGLERLRRAQEARNAADIQTAAAALDDIEALAIRRHGEDGPLGRLWDHIESLTETRRLLQQGATEGNLVYPIAEPPGSRNFVEGMGRKFDTESARFGPFRGQTYAQVEAEIGRPPDKIEGTPPGRVRLTWQLGDNSFIHVDVPGPTNTSPFQINREAHVARTASSPNEKLHLSEEGIGVPVDSTPAHATITPDALLQKRIMGDRS